MSIELRSYNMSFDRSTPNNMLALLPPDVDIETKAILKQSIAANRALSELKGYAQTLPNQELLINGIVLQEARLSSEIENIVTTDDDLFQAAGDERSLNPHTKEVLYYREALWTGFRSLIKRPLSVNTFIEIFQIIKQSNAGIRKTTGTKIANGSITLYTPPEGEEVIRQKLSNLEQFIHAEDDIDLLVKMAIVHYQFEAIHPFIDGNGRTGRILNILYLIEKGLLDIPVLYLSSYIIHNKTDYYEGLRRVTEEEDWESWVLYMLRAIESTAIETKAKILAIRELMEHTQELARENAGKAYSKELVELIFEHPYCKSKFLEERTIAKRQTAAEYLKTFESLGILRSEKVGREVYYINDALIEIFTR